MSALVSVADVDPAAVKLLDVRWTLAEPDGHPAYLAGHLPGAVWVDLENELSGHGAASDGRHPLPGLAALQEAARRWGLDDGDTVVVYDDANGLAAARAWWLLRDSVDVRVLDGGIAAWRAAGRPLEQGDVVPAAGSLTLSPPRGAVGIDDAAAIPTSGVLIDARAPERYRGEVEPLDPIPGHIPGAVNVPLAALVQADGRMRDAEALRAVFAAAGVTGELPVVAYCGSGVTASHTVLALAELGVDAALYPGSWSAWSNTPGRPVATGPTPAEEVR